MKFFKVDTKAKVLRYVFVLTLTIMAVWQLNMTINIII